jgi:hypothetical protein
MATRRTLLSGVAILALSFLAGIFLSFYQWDHGSPFERSSWGGYNPLGRATYAPLALAFIFFPITLPIVVVVFFAIVVSISKEKLWPVSLLGFLSMGVLWLWYLTTMWNFD